MRVRPDPLAFLNESLGGLVGLGLAVPGGAGRAERGPGRRPARHEHPEPRGAGGAAREERA